MKKPEVKQIRFTVEEFEKVSHLLKNHDGTMASFVHSVSFHEHKVTVFVFQATSPL